MVGIDDLVKKLNDKLDETGPGLRGLDTYYAGEQPASFMSKESREALSGALTQMSVNFPKLVVTSLAERLEVTGFRRDGQNHEGLWSAWRRNRLRDLAAQAHLDALVYGRSHVIVWADDRGRASVTVESPLQVAVLRDPVTRQVTAGLKRWVDADGFAGAALYLPDEVRLLRGNRVVNVETTSSWQVPVDGFTSTGWTVVETVRNPMGVVPVVPIVNRGRLTEIDGRSEMTDVLGLTDALNKLMEDAMVSSEYFARPRRWVTGLEIQEDEDGKPVYPFTDNERTGKAFIAEDPAVKFGQFAPSDLSAYSNLTATMTQQIGALSGLPPHYLGLHGDQPASADAIRSAEASLVARCVELQRTFGQAWGDVAALMLAIEEKLDPAGVDVEPVWASPETRTPAQAADAAAKLAGIGVPLEVVLADTLGFTPEQVARVKGLQGDSPVAQVEEKVVDDAA